MTYPPQPHHAAAASQEISEAHAGAESADALPHAAALTLSVARGGAAGGHTSGGSGASPVATSSPASNHVTDSGVWSGLQGLTAADQVANGVTASGMPFAVDSEEPQLAADTASALPAMPTANAERSSMHGSESNGTMHERRYSSGTEYSMSKLPEVSAGLSALAPGARPPLVPTPARSTPGSSPRARSISASGEKARALQQYVAALESDKYELQRGLKRQMELVRKLADDHQDAENALAASRAEASELRDEVEKTRTELSEKVRASTIHLQTFYW